MNITTDEFTQAARMPEWGTNGELTTSFVITDEQNDKTVMASIKVRAEGIWAPELSVTSSVDLSWTELQILHQQLGRMLDKRAAELEADKNKRPSEIPTRTWDI